MMPRPLNISLPLWLLARAKDVRVDDKLPIATSNDPQQSWMQGRSPSGKKVLMVFTSYREATQFASEHIANSRECLAAELDAQQLFVVLDEHGSSGGIEAVRIDNRYNIPLPPFQRWVRDQLLRELAAAEPPIFPHNLESAERQVYSQNGEDGVIEAMFAAIGTTNRFFVEFGCEDGSECNAANLVRHHAWRGLWMDAAYESHDPTVPIRKEIVTADNIDSLLRKYKVPQEFDLLSIDIDGNDFWVWKAISHRPRVVVIEYNAHFPPPLRRAICYEPDFRWQGTDYYGASLAAMAELGRLKGYTLVHCEGAGNNAFFIANDALPGDYVPRSVDSIFRPANLFYLRVCWPRDKERTMIDPFAD